MLQTPNRQLSGGLPSESLDHDPLLDIIDLDAIMGITRRQWLVVAAAMGVAIVLGVVYSLTAIPLYTSKVSVLIDRSNSQVVEQLSTIGGVLDDEASILSQVELLKSDAIGVAVVDKLNLINNPEFTAPQGSIFSTIKSAIGSALNVSEWFVSDEVSVEELEARRRSAVAKLLSNMDVARVGKTYVLEISYLSASPDLSARIANGLAEEYLVDKLNSKYEATRRASSWLQDRIAELRQKALDSDLAVQKFRTTNGLVSAGNVLVSDQQLSELNSALIVTQADTAKAKAKLAQIEQIIASGQTNAIVTDVLDSSVSNQLRQKYLAASKLEGEISSRLGPNHIQAVRLRGEMDEYKRLMFDELNRIAESYRSDVSIASAREQSLQQSVADATGVSAVANETKVQLRELEREAETYKNLYQTFLQRYQEAVQQQSFPVTEARIITRAIPSLDPSHPRKALILALFSVIGAAAGCGIGAFREFRDRFFRTGDQVRDSLGLEFLGIAPIIRKTVNASPSGIVGLNNKTIRKNSTVANYIVDHPLSSFAETLRSAKIAADLTIAGKKCKIIGVVSALPGEGKSTVSTNFAELLASQGARTVLIDADLRNPGATRSLALHAQAGLLEALMGGQDVRSLLFRNEKTNLSFLPAVIKHRIPHSSELLTSAAMRGVLSTLAEDFDYIIVDLPPLGALVDARAMASRIDGFVFVVEWGRTGRRVVRQILEAETQIRSKCLGVVLNKVDQEKMKLYRAYGSTDYYYSRYSDYYQEES